MGSTAITAICGLAALGFNTRSLGPHEFGVLALIQTYVALVGVIATFESWQPVIRLGIRAPNRIGLIVSTGILIDTVAAVLATVVAILGILFFGGLVGIDTAYQDLAIVYSLSLLGGVAGTPKGFFRLRNRFDLLARNQVALAVAMFIAAVALWWFGGSLAEYVTVFAAIAFTYKVSLLLGLMLGFAREGRKLVNPLGSASRRRMASMMMKMAGGSSLFVTFSNTRRHLALLIVGSVLGEVAAGIFAFAARLASAASKLAQIINQVLFSEVLQASARYSREDWRRIVSRLTVIAFFLTSIMALLAFACSSTLVDLIGGQAYSDAASLFAILFAAECVTIAGIHFNPVIQGEAGTRPLVMIACMTTLFYIPFAALLSIRLGAEGGALAFLLASGLTYALMLQTTNKLLGPAAPAFGKRVEL